MITGGRDWTAITSSSDGTMLAAVIYGENIWTSTDSGVSWRETSTGSPQQWRGISLSSDGMKIAAIVEGGSIWTSDRTWRQPEGRPPPVRDLTDQSLNRLRLGD